MKKKFWWAIQTKRHDQGPFYNHVLGFVVVKKSIKYSTKILLGSRANDALPAAKWPPLLLLLIGFQVWHFETAALLCNSSDARKSVKLALMHQCTEGLCIVQIFGQKKKESHWWYWFRIWVNYISKELNPKVEMKNKGIFFNKRYINFRHFGFHFKI